MKLPPTPPRFVRPSWQLHFSDAMPYSVKALLTAYRMAKGAPELYVEIPLAPPSVNAIYRKFRRKGTGKVGMSIDPAVISYRDMTAASLWGKRWSATGVIGCVIVVESSRWVSKKHAIERRDVDNPIKVVLDAVSHSLNFDDKMIWEVHSAKQFGRREATHVWLFDLGEVVTAVGANRVI